MTPEFLPLLAFITFGTTSCGLLLKGRKIGGLAPKCLLLQCSLMAILQAGYMYSDVLSTRPHPLHLIFAVVAALAGLVGYRSHGWLRRRDSTRAESTKPVSDSDTKPEEDRKEEEDQVGSGDRLRKSTASVLIEDDTGHAVIDGRSCLCSAKEGRSHQNHLCNVLSSPVLVSTTGSSGDVSHLHFRAESGRFCLANAMKVNLGEAVEGKGGNSWKVLERITTHIDLIVPDLCRELSVVAGDDVHDDKKDVANREESILINVERAKVADVGKWNDDEGSEPWRVAERKSGKVSISAKKEDDDGDVGVDAGDDDHGVKGQTPQ